MTAVVNWIDIDSEVLLLQFTSHFFRAESAGDLAKGSFWQRKFSDGYCKALQFIDIEIGAAYARVSVGCCFSRKLAGSVAVIVESQSQE